MLKEWFQKRLIRLLGFDNYLYFVSVIRIWTMRLRPSHQDFLYFVEMIPRGLDVLDIGANIGITTYFLARKCRPFQVHAFEPVPANYRNLRKIAEKFNLPNVRLYECGLGSKSETLSMIMPVIHGVPRHALCQVEGKNQTYFDGERFAVSIRRLDDVEALKNRSVGAIKIDVEDYEYFVLMGGIELIRTHRPIVFCELWDSENKRRVLNLFSELGYQSMVYNKGRLRDISSVDKKKGNYFFIPEAQPSGARPRAGFQNQPFVSP